MALVPGRREHSHGATALPYPRPRRAPRLVVGLGEGPPFPAATQAMRNRYPPHRFAALSRGLPSCLKRRFLP